MFWNKAETYLPETVRSQAFKSGERVLSDPESSVVGLGKARWGAARAQQNTFLAPLCLLFFTTYFLLVRFSSWVSNLRGPCLCPRPGEPGKGLHAELSRCFLCTSHGAGNCAELQGYTDDLALGKFRARHRKERKCQVWLLSL